MRWSGTRRLREAGACIDRGMGGMRQGCVAGEGWPRVAGPALGCSERQCTSKGSDEPEVISTRHATSHPIHCASGLSSVAPHTDSRRVPVLRLSGLWLEQLGFAIGSKVRIAVRAGEVVVSVVGAEPSGVCNLDSSRGG